MGHWILISGNIFFFLLFLIGKNRHGIQAYSGIGKKVAIFEWEWAEIWPLEKGRKCPDSTCKSFYDQSHGK